MYDAILGLIGQSGKQAAERDMKDYDPSKGGLKDRQGLEVLGDMLRGGSGAVNDAARELHIQNLKGTEAADYLESRGIDSGISATSTKAKLLGQARDERKSETREDRTTDYATNPVIQQQLTDAKTDREYLRSRDSEADRRFQTTQLESIDARRDQTALGMAQLDIARQQEANRMSEETRRYDQRRADSKKERMAAIIAGLANLGGAFAI